MSTLVVLAFPNETGAQDVLAVIDGLQRQHLITLDDAVTVVRGQDGNPRIKQATGLIAEGARGGAFEGTPFFGFLSFTHFLGIAIDAVADALNRNLTDVGIDDRFIRDVQDKIKPGQSALFLYVREVQLDRVLPALEPYHPEVLQTSLSPEQEARLREALSGTPPKASPVVEDRSAVPETTAEDLAPDEAGFRYLFDNTSDTFANWRYVGEGSFVVVDGALEAHPGEDFGVLYYGAETFGDFDLRLEFRLDRIDSDSGVFVRFRDPSKPVPDRDDPAIVHQYDKQQWVAVNTGFEVQIDELARGSDEERDEHRTGAIYDIPLGLEPGQQRYTRPPALTPGTWHRFEIVLRDNTYLVALDGAQTTTFTNADPFRGLPPTAEASSGYIGLQAYVGQVSFRSVRVKTP